MGIMDKEIRRQVEILVEKLLLSPGESMEIAPE
jgi:hypothetical protein